LDMSVSTNIRDLSSDATFCGTERRNMANTWMSKLETIVAQGVLGMGKDVGGPRRSIYVTVSAMTAAG
jgi:hypothetical protein